MISLRSLSIPTRTREIDQIGKESKEVERELEELDSLKDQLPTLEERRTQLRYEIDETSAELVTLKVIEERDSGIEETREVNAELKERLEDFWAKRSALENVCYDLETERESLESAWAEK